MLGIKICKKLNEIFKIFTFNQDVAEYGMTPFGKVPQNLDAVHLIDDEKRALTFDL